MEVKSGCRTLVVVGGGASGYFGAIQAASSTATGINDARSNDALQVVVLEAAKKPLSKVKISGGGRCNVMHDERKVRLLNTFPGCNVVRPLGVAGGCDGG